MAQQASQLFHKETESIDIPKKYCRIVEYVQTHATEALTPPDRKFCIKLDKNIARYAQSILLCGKGKSLCLHNDADVLLFV